MRLRDSEGKARRARVSVVLAQELAPLGVRVKTVQPGGMKTDWAGPRCPFPLQAALRTDLRCLRQDAARRRGMTRPIPLAASMTATLSPE